MDTKGSSPRPNEIPEKNNKTVAATSENTASSTASKDPLLTRKAYYESWDKYDVDQALDDVDVKKDDKNPPPEKTISSHAIKTEAAAPGKSKTADPAAAIIEKEKGNDFFKKKEYQKAIEHYSASMALDPSNSILPINRAMALLKVERFTDAERDCTLGLKLDSKNVKALWRRGIARRSLGRVDDARRDFEAALKIDPINKAVKEELAKLQQQPTTSTVKTSTPPSSAKQLSTPAVKKQETKASTSSSAKDTASSTVVSSKRVQIKEVENDEGSELFTSAAPAIKKHIPLTTPPPMSPLPLTMEPTTLQASETAPLQSAPTTTNELSTLAAPQTTASPPSSYSTSKESNQGVHMSPPMTTLDFHRDWKSYSKNNGLLYQYIKVRKDSYMAKRRANEQLTDSY
ncbi:hypothetical protein EDD21DRAFT_24703 [Dissophora ornata]|nr:hypothetical protein EDD21DRAFT_24703 [Dissophora ornata]